MDWKGGPPEPGKWGRKKKQFFGRSVPAVLEFLPPSQENSSSPSPFSPLPPPPPPPRQFKQSPGKDEKMKRGRRKRAPLPLLRVLPRDPLTERKRKWKKSFSIPGSLLDFLFFSQGPIGPSFGFVSERSTDCCIFFIPSGSSLFIFYRFRTFCWPVIGGITLCFAIFFHCRFSIRLFSVSLVRMKTKLIGTKITS